MLTKKEIGTVQRNLESAPENRVAFVFEALSNPTRLKIFRLLSRKKGVCVTDVANVLGISVPAVSYQFRILEMAGLVEPKRSGQMICYELKEKEPVVRSLLSMIQ